MLSLLLRLWVLLLNLRFRWGLWRAELLGFLLRGGELLLESRALLGLFGGGLGGELLIRLLDALSDCSLRGLVALGLLRLRLGWLRGFLWLHLIFRRRLRRSRGGRGVLAN